MVLGAVDGAMDVVVVNMKLYEKIAMVDFVARRQICISGNYKCGLRYIT